MGLQMHWSPAVLQTLAREAPAGSDKWLNVTEAGLRSGAGLGMAAINLKAAARQGYALVRNSDEGQLEYQATERLGEHNGTMYDSSRPRGERLG